MILGEDYVLAVENENDWSVILNNDPWEDVVVRYHNVQILEGGTQLSFQHEVMFNPYDADVTTIEFEDHIAEILNSVILYFDSQGGIIYKSKKTGDLINV